MNASTLSTAICNTESVKSNLSNIKHCGLQVWQHIVMADCIWHSTHKIDMARITSWN